MPLQAILFDLDETLHDREATNAPYLRALFARSGRGEFDAFRRRWQELDEWGHAEKSALFGPLVTEGFLNATVADLIRDYREQAWRTPCLMPDTLEVLAELRARGYRLGIITNGVTRSQQEKIERLGLESLMDAILISEREGLRKPEPEIFHRAAARLSVDPTQCAFVGDHPEKDVVGAYRAGLHAVWFHRGTPWPPDLEPAPHLTIRSLPELLAAREFSVAPL